MTTAARPTFDPAKGGSSLQDTSKGRLSHSVSSRDQPAHLKLKERLAGQDTQDEIKQRDFKAELEERERVAQIAKSKEPFYKPATSIEQATQVRLAIKAERDRERAAKKERLLISGPPIKEELNSNDLDDNGSYDDRPHQSRKIYDGEQDSDIELSESDFEDDDDEDQDPEDEEEEEDEDEDEDEEEEEEDTEALMAELAKIKQERLAEKERREREAQEKTDRLNLHPIGDETPASSNFSIKRRWDDDVPFKNCARGEPDPKKKIYLNDTIRQDSHKKFMDRYIR